jgi:hypothetical protein
LAAATGGQTYWTANARDACDAWAKRRFANITTLTSRGVSNRVAMRIGLRSRGGQRSRSPVVSRRDCSLQRA